ncbi:MAG: hypothetical protein NT036_03485, partial [Candidatus Omnitrophica bacterium]|nr:hypothetical protein [Candidatus Omnitrophota bacterium]
ALHTIIGGVAGASGYLHQRKMVYKQMLKLSEEEMSGIFGTETDPKYPTVEQLNGLMKKKAGLETTSILGETKDGDYIRDDTGRIWLLVTDKTHNKPDKVEVYNINGELESTYLGGIDGSADTIKAIKQNIAERANMPVISKYRIDVTKRFEETREIAETRTYFIDRTNPASPREVLDSYGVGNLLDNKTIEEHKLLIDAEDNYRLKKDRSKVNPKDIARYDVTELDDNTTTKIYEFGLIRKQSIKLDNGDSVVVVTKYGDPLDPMKETGRDSYYEKKGSLEPVRISTGFPLRVENGKTFVESHKFLFDRAGNIMLDKNGMPRYNALIEVYDEVGNLIRQEIPDALNGGVIKDGSIAGLKYVIDIELSKTTGRENSRTAKYVNGKAEEFLLSKGTFKGHDLTGNAIVDIKVVRELNQGEKRREDDIAWKDSTGKERIYRKVYTKTEIYDVVGNLRRQEIITKDGKFVIDININDINSREKGREAKFVNKDGKEFPISKGLFVEFDEAGNAVVDIQKFLYTKDGDVLKDANDKPRYTSSIEVYDPVGNLIRQEIPSPKKDGKIVIENTIVNGREESRRAKFVNKDNKDFPLSEGIFVKFDDDGNAVVDIHKFLYDKDGNILKDDNGKPRYNSSIEVYDPVGNLLRQEIAVNDGNVVIGKIVIENIIKNGRGMGRKSKFVNNDGEGFLLSEGSFVEFDKDNNAIVEIHKFLHDKDGKILTNDKGDRYTVSTELYDPVGNLLRRNTSAKYGTIVVNVDIENGREVGRNSEFVTHLKEGVKPSPISKGKLMGYDAKGNTIVKIIVLRADGKTTAYEKIEVYDPVGNLIRQEIPTTGKECTINSEENIKKGESIIKGSRIEITVTSNPRNGIEKGREARHYRDEKDKIGSLLSKGDFLGYDKDDNAMVKIDVLYEAKDDKNIKFKDKDGKLYKLAYSKMEFYDPVGNLVLFQTYKAPGEIRPHRQAYGGV